jgi:hypothetical protein
MGMSLVLDLPACGALAITAIPVLIGGHPGLARGMPEVALEIPPSSPPQLTQAHFVRRVFSVTSVTVFSYEIP